MLSLPFYLTLCDYSITLGNTCQYILAEKV
nr:MAG TPA: hypothetical protein [Bacteriophage sp.]